MKKSVVSVGEGPRRTPRVSWDRLRMLDCWTVVVRRVRGRRGLLFACAVALAYLERVGGVVRDVRKEVRIGDQDARSIR